MDACCLLCEFLRSKARTDPVFPISEFSIPRESRRRRRGVADFGEELDHHTDSRRLRNAWLELKKNSLNHLHVSKVEQMESELRKLSQAELRQIRGWLDDLIEDDLEFTPEFERSIQQAERDMADKKSARVREPEHD